MKKNCRFSFFFRVLQEILDAEKPQIVKLFSAESEPSLSNHFHQEQEQVQVHLRKSMGISFSFEQKISKLQIEQISVNRFV